MPLEMWEPGSDPAPADGRHEPKRGPGSERELRFRRQPMVRWLDPKQLAATGVKTLLSTIFGSYADRRETQAALSAGRLHRFDDQNEIWLDYTADLGDGFTSTYTVARQLAAETLEAEAYRLPRGRILILGGDAVYPAPARDEYRDRFSGPYEAALPGCDGDDHPYLFAIPGNHDWYDGLTGFLRLFCQKRWIGGWRTAQSRSYFALRLPQRWWLLGTDFQLHADVDQPQIDYFREVAAAMEPGDRVILCTAEPSWVRVPGDARAFDNLAFFEREVLHPVGAVVALTLAGDLHHYARFASENDDEQRITVGGGGAYLYATQCLPESVTVEHGDGVSTRYRRAATFPDFGDSRVRRAGALFAFRKNPGFSAVLAAIYVFYAWLLQSASRPAALPGCGDFMDCVNDIALSPAGLPAVLGTFWKVLAHAPLLFLLTALLVGALTAFCTPDPGRSRKLKWLGAVHGGLHVLMAVVLTWVFARVNTGNSVVPIRLPIDSLAQMLLFVAEMAVIGGVLGGVLFGLFLLPGVNVNEAYSSQHIEDFKSFVRLHIDRAGVLTVYPIGIRRVGHLRYVFRPDAPAGEPWFVPSSEPPRPELIERPIGILNVQSRTPTPLAGATAR